MLASVLVMSALLFFERPVADFATTFLPIQTEIQLLAPDFSVLSTSVTEVGSTTMYQVRAEQTRAINIKGHILLPSGWKGVLPRTAKDYDLPVRVVEYCAMTLILVLAWPASALREFALRVVLSIALMALQFMIAVPSQALAALWKEARSEMDAQGFSGWMLWSSSMIDGGGLVLGCILGGLAILLAKRLQESRRSAVQETTCAKLVLLPRKSLELSAPRPSIPQPVDPTTTRVVYSVSSINNVSTTITYHIGNIATVETSHPSRNDLLY